MKLRLATALAALAALVGAPVAHAEPPAEPLPVDYNFFSGFPAEIANPGGSLPGTNDFSCRPSAEHPNPVILVHGTGTGQQTGWGVYAPLLKNEGYCVFALTYGALPGPWPIAAVGGLNIDPAAKGAQFAAFTDQVLQATGAEKVDVVGHSQGTVVPNYYAQFLGGADRIDKYVSLAPLWKRGSSPMLGWPAQTYEYVPTIAYTNIVTRYDQLVVPYTDGIVEARNATNIVVQDTCDQDFSEHAGIVGSPRAAAMVLNALDPANPRPVPCEFVPPFTG